VSYGVAQCYMPPALTHLGTPVLNFPNLEGWKAELTWVICYVRDGLPARRQSPIQVVTGPGVEQLQQAARERFLCCISYLQSLM